MTKITGILTAVLVLVLAFFVMLQSRSNERPRPKNETGNFPRLVILYATCSLNKDHLAPYDSRVRYTPNLKTFAEESVVFRRHETESGFSGAAYANLLTGSFMYRHGVYYHPRPLSSDSYLIAEAFQADNFETFFWNAHSLASAEYHYDQGIRPKDVIQFSPGIGGLTHHDKKFISILKRLNSQPDYKAFIQVAFTMTHAPYSNNSDIKTTEEFCRSFAEECSPVTAEDLLRYRAIYAKNYIRLQTDFDNTIKSLHLNSEEVQKLIDVIRIMYDSSVHLLDSRFGEMLDAIRTAGLMNQSLIVFTSDHGEILYRPDARTKWTHGNLEPEVIDVPLLIRMPNGTGAGKHYENVTRSVDVFPTVAALSGVAVHSKEKIDGTDLSPSITGRVPPPDLIAFSCTGLSHPVRGMNNDPAKMGVQARAGDLIYRLFTLEDGSYVMTILRLSDGVITMEPFDPGNPAHPRMKSLLLAYKERLVHGYKRPTDQSNWNEIQERLRSLGYMN